MGRTEDEKKKLKSLSYKMRKFPKDLIDDIKKKFPFLQRTPKTAEQRQEQVKECNRQKRGAESEIEKERILKKKKEYDHEKRSAESEKEKEMRLYKQKEYEHKRYTKSTELRAKKVQEVREKRFAESEIEKERRLTQDKEYHSQKRSEESEIEKERRLNNQKECNEKRSGQSDIEKERRLTQDKEYHRQKRRQPSKDWKQELIDKASLIHICTSECRYRPKGSMVVVRDKMFTSKQMRLLKINNEILSIDGKYYVCKSCKNSIQKNKIPPCNEISKKFMIDKLPEKFVTEKMSLSKLESHLLKLIIPFIRIAVILI